MRYINEDTALEMFNAELDEFDIVTIAGVSFAPSRILEELDPTTYRCAFLDWLDANELTTDESEAEDSDDDE